MAETQTTKFEYKILDCAGAGVTVEVADLNFQGQMGWRVVASLPNGNIILERPHRD